MGLVWSQARWFEIPLLDEGDFQPCFGFPHKKELKTQGLGLRMWWSWVIMVFKVRFSIKRTMEVMVDRVKQQWFWLVVLLLW